MFGIGISSIGLFYFSISGTCKKAEKTFSSDRRETFFLEANFCQDLKFGLFLNAIEPRIEDRAVSSMFSFPIFVDDHSDTQAL